MSEIDTEVRLTKNEESYSPAIAGAIAAAEAWLKAVCAMAVKFPRDMDKVRQNILRECERPAFAALAMYAKPVGGGKVTGLSIRFAEGMMQAMGHIHTTTQTLAETDEFRKIELRVWDAQTMNSHADEATIQKTIERKSVPKERMGEVLRQRHNASGEILYIIRAEEGDMLNQVNAAKSKSMRNAGLRLIPAWLLDECKQAIKDTMNKKDAKDPDKSKRELFDAFVDIGVTVEQIKRYLGHDNATLQPAELDDLRKLYTAIKTGETTMKAIFDVREESAKEPAPDAKGTNGLKQRMAATQQPLQPTEQASDDAQPPQESAGVIEAVTAGHADNSKPGKVQIGTKEYTTFDKKLIVLASSLHRKGVNFNYRVVEKAGRQYFNLVSIEAQ